ncbi:MAG: GFA family protein [Alphaproteobacteria bacterium]|nr:GFA family protein [Alphaproteobacteria bacterium]
MALSGGCACGRVRYQINDELMFTHACHCTDCQRTTGSAFVIHSVLARDELEIEGETQAATLPTGSGVGCDIHFCAACGTYIWCHYLYHKVPVIALRAGTLDDPTQVRPQAHIYTRSMQPWLRLPDGVPAFDEAFDRNAVWPADSSRKYDSLAEGH